MEIEVYTAQQRQQAHYETEVGHDEGYTTYTLKEYYAGSYAGTTYLVKKMSRPDCEGRYVVTINGVPMIREIRMLPGGRMRLIRWDDGLEKTGDHIDVSMRSRTVKIVGRLERMLRRGLSPMQQTQIRVIPRNEV